MCNPITQKQTFIFYHNLPQTELSLKIVINETMIPSQLV